MICPKCSTRDTRVIDSRIGRNGLSIRRRRECTACDYRFTTIEEVLRGDRVVIKSDGRREEFDRNKMLHGIRRACEKRPIDLEQIDMLISDVVIELEGEFDQEIPSATIGEWTMAKLRSIDNIAYIRFASAYRNFHEESSNSIASRPNE